MFNITDQLSGSFEELMVEIRAMRRELERIRKAVEAQPPAASKLARSARSAHTAPRSRKTVA
jgi:hypothetical protein